jgi:hypothetical protein
MKKCLKMTFSRNKKGIGRIHTNAEIAQILTDIRQLRDSNKSDNEIKALLGIEPRQYQRLTKKICEQDQKVWFSITQGQLGTELLRMKQSLEDTYKIARQMSEDPKCKDRLAALQSKDDGARLSIIQLQTDVDMIRKLQVQPSQDKASVRAYEEKYEWRENGERVLNETE